MCVYVFTTHGVEYFTCKIIILEDLHIWLATCYKLKFMSQYDIVIMVIGLLHLYGYRLMVDDMIPTHKLIFVLHLDYIFSRRPVSNRNAFTIN